MIPKTLFLTNGDSAAKIMQELNFEGDIVPWRDVLHEGEVPAHLDFTTLAQVRAKFIITQGWGDADSVYKHFNGLIALMEEIRYYRDVELWFEHDFYDQLQILQILDLLADKDLEVSIICSENYLGEQSPKSLLKLYQFQERVTPKHYALAQKAWQAFRMETPLSLQALLDEDTSALPFLHSAIKRLLQEYPSCDNGLPHSMQKAFEIIANGESKPWRVFQAYQESEEAPFMGDSSFWALLNKYIDTPTPLLQTSSHQKLSPPFDQNERITLTPLGLEVMEAKRSWWDIGIIDRYIGGVHIVNKSSWCWKRGEQRVIQW
jgi:hypothetical protein